MDDTQLLKGVLDLAVLRVLAAGPSYGYEIVTRLREAGHETVGEASVYGTLRRLHADDCLESSLVASEAGPPRKYYELTPAGERRMKDDAKNWRRFVETMTYLLEEQP